MAVTAINSKELSFLIGHDLAISQLAPKNGPPARKPGLTVGIVDMTRDAPHNGEMHPDGDELVYVISGCIEVTCDSSQDTLTLSSGDACIVPKGEWHNVHLKEPSRLLHITPGPNGEHRPL